MEDALKAATHPHDFKLLVSSDGMRSSSAESVFAPRTTRRSSRTLRTLRAPAANGAPAGVTGAPGA